MTRYGSRRKPIEIGFRSGKLVVVKESNKRSSDRQIMYECLCDCGEVSIVRGQHLRHRITLSCGCLIKEHIASVNRSHEMSGSSTHRAWTNMKTRCTNKSIPDYVHYGERGIKVCSRWQNSFANFLEDMGVKPEGLTLDRIDTDGDYTPSNCRWATPKTQNNK